MQNLACGLGWLGKTSDYSDSAFGAETCSFLPKIGPKIDAEIDKAYIETS
jgi:hypothetical protein